MRLPAGRKKKNGKKTAIKGKYMEKKRKPGYYHMYLREYLRKKGDGRAEDEEFIENRAAAAEREFDGARKERKTVSQALGRAMEVLTDGLRL